MKIGILTNAFKEERFIKGCIEQFKPFDFEHVVLTPIKSWNGKYELEENDPTVKIALREGATVRIGDWKSASEQLNYGLSRFKDHDWVFICDVDERYKKEDLKHMFKYIHTVNSPVIKTNEWTVYWKTPNYSIVPRQTDWPTIAVRPNVKFANIRDTGLEWEFMTPHMHHFSYVRTDEEMLKKISTFDAAKQFDVLNWYNDIWLKWNKDMTNIHPVNPPQFKRAIYNPPPKEILDLLW